MENFHPSSMLVWSLEVLMSLQARNEQVFQPILAKKVYDIYEFQIFKKNTIFRNILNIRRLCLDCIRHFTRLCYFIGHRQVHKYLIIFNLIQHFTEKMTGNLICSKVPRYLLKMSFISLVTQLATQLGSQLSFSFYLKH